MDWLLLIIVMAVWDTVRTAVVVVVTVYITRRAQRNGKENDEKKS